MPARVTQGVIAEFMHRQVVVRFFADDAEDVIQGCHVRGEFYEQEELAIIEQHLPAGGVYLDVGANVGNHVVFVAKFCTPSEIIAVEPNVTALKFLEINLALNRIDATVLPFGLSDRASRAEARWPNNNLGGAQLIPQADGTVRVLPGDDLLSGRRIDFIKLDVELAELAVLRGLQRTIEANRPAILIEVDDTNVDELEVWAGQNRYGPAWRLRRYSTNSNFLLRPL